MMVLIEKGMETSREKLLHRFVDVQYERSEDLRRGTFRVRGDIIEIYPPYEDNAYRIEMWGNQIDTLRQIDPLTGEIRPGQENLSRVSIYPKTHYVMPAEQRERAIQGIYAELDWWKKELEHQGKIVEAQRVMQRTMFDIEMMRTVGYCHGVENYSRHSQWAACREKRRRRCSIISRRTICCSSTSRTRPCRKRAGCMAATDRENRFSSIMDFGCRRRSTIGR